MEKRISRRAFVQTSAAMSAAIPLAFGAADSPLTSAPADGSGGMPCGKIGGQEFSRLMMGGNLIGGWAHARDLSYVSMLMRHYNTPAKVRQTLEIGEAHGITAINTWVMDDNTQIFEHWKCGGKMKWFAQARIDAAGGFSQIQKAIDQGAVGVHLTGDSCEALLTKGGFDKVGETVQFIKSQKRIAGVAAHDLQVIVECEKRGLDVDFYQKTLHSHDYFTAPEKDESGALGAHDNSWCQDPQEVVAVMAKVNKPWIAFKILAAGAIHPRTAFPYAFKNGADFILVGMFDWQIEEDAKLAKRVATIVASGQRSRTWF
ncbi:MAG: hypothetical protein U1G07_13060 [Verrucomicrobiota bacterium]